MFISDLYALEMGPIQASRGESVGWTYIRAKQSWHSLLYVTPSVPQTGLNDWEQSGVSAICSQTGCGEREGTQGFRGSEGNPGPLLGAKGAPRKEPNSRGPQCGSSEHETNHSGPLGMSACACMAVAVTVAVCTLVCTCVLSPGVPVFMSVCGVSVYPQAYGLVHTLLR